MASPVDVDSGSSRRFWRVTTLALRLVCFALLVLMFSLKLRDFLRQPVVTETNVVWVSPPAITICPSAMNSSVLLDVEWRWRRGLLTTEEVLRAVAAPLTCNVLACSTADGDSCTPGGEEQNGGSCMLGDEALSDDLSQGYPKGNRSGSPGFQALWQSRRVPPGITCHTLKLSSAPDTPISETLLTLALHSGFIHPHDGYYRLFFHAERTPKTWYGGTLVSAYHLVHNGFFQELSLTQTEMWSVDRPSHRCQSSDDYDLSQCLLDCRSLAAFTEANCSVQWGAAIADLPPCTNMTQYDQAVRAWKEARPSCHHCLQPCRTHLITLKSHPAMHGFTPPMIQLQIRSHPQQLLVEQRFSYTLVDLLVDLGGTLGLLLGCSLISLVDLLDSALGWVDSRRRRQERLGGAVAAPADPPAPDVVFVME